MKNSDFHDCLHALDRIRDILFEMYYYNPQYYDPVDAISVYIDIIEKLIGGN